MQPRTTTLNRVSLCLCTFTLTDGESGESALLISQHAASRAARAAPFAAARSASICLAARCSNRLRTATDVPLYTTCSSTFGSGFTKFNHDGLWPAPRTRPPTLCYLGFLGRLQLDALSLQAPLFSYLGLIGPPGPCSNSLSRHC